MQFSFRQGWFCHLLEEDLKTRLPRTVVVADDQKLLELGKRGGFTLNIMGRQELETAIRKKRGGIWLELTGETNRTWFAPLGTKARAHELGGAFEPRLA